MLTPIRWNEDGYLQLLDQRLLPEMERWNSYHSADKVAAAIGDMVVRGAPAIGVTAAYGMVLGALELVHTERDETGDEGDHMRGGIAARGQEYMHHLLRVGNQLDASRPTASNLGWAVRSQLQAAARIVAGEGSASDLYAGLLYRAQRIHEEDVRSCREIGRHGAGLLRDGDRVLTHCNAGALATGGYGTALGVIRFAHEAGMNISVLATETRPFLQGARLTSWELSREGIPVRLLVDSAAGVMMSKGEVDAVVVGADRITANGDTANKVGTYLVALAAREHGIPFYVAAPISTLDCEIPDGSGVQIERRESGEITEFLGRRTAPDMVDAVNYAFDITPAALISAIITERGVVRPPFEEELRRLKRESNEDDVFGGGEHA